MPRVLVCDKLEAPGLQLLRQAGIELDERTGLKDAALQEAIRAADGVIVRSGTRITAAELENPGRLRAIVRAGVGVDNIDLDAATRRGIVVMNTPGGNTVSTAEHTVALLLALARHLPAADVDNPGRLRASVRAWVGVDNIDPDAAARRGTVVMNTPGGNPVSTAEHTVALLLALAGHLPAADASFRQGKWERGKFTGSQ